MNAEEISSSKVPLILRNCLTWGILNWSLDDWKIFLQSDNPSRTYKFRKGSQYCREEPLWERNCNNLEISMAEFFEVCNSKGVESRDWLYFDYKHINEWFNTEADKLDVCWKDFGFPEKTARDSTIWIGSKDAHTPCHMDTYGFNLIAQLHGQKRWYLFPPTETDNLKPTRVPYEESSVYSDINFACGCGDVSGINEARVAVLNPGDVLVVPYHWWHFVENLSTAISINIWLPSIYDDTSRLEESLVKYFVCSVCRSIDRLDDILNPNEDDVPSIKEEFNIKELSWCLKECKPLKKDCNHKHFGCINEVPLVSSEEFSKILKSKCSGPRSDSKEYIRTTDENIRKEIINAFCHPDVITLVREKLQNTKTNLVIRNLSTNK